MIHCSFAFKNWESIPLTTKEEVQAPKASLKFYAKSSTSEKVKRGFNQFMFGIVGGKLVSKILIGTLGKTKFGRAGISKVNHLPVIQKLPLHSRGWAIASKMILTVAVITVIQKILAVVANHLIYPAVLMTYSSKKGWLQNERCKTFDHYTKSNYACHRVALNKSGIDYDSFVFEHASTKGNSKWAIVAGGNAMIGEDALFDSSSGFDLIDKFKNLGFNVLYVNGPGVGGSTGFPTSYSIGAGQEAGLQFLEETVGAKKILMYGLSLGGGAQAEAVQSHEFKQGVNYLVWSDRTFDRLSNAASSMVTYLAKPIFRLLGIELNGVKAEEKLEKLGIRHIITQHSNLVQTNGTLPLMGDMDLTNETHTDGVIPDEATLYRGIREAGFHDLNRLKCFGGPGVKHNGDLPNYVQNLVNAEIKNF